MAIYLNGIKVAGRGISGKSPYEIAKEGGYTGTESAFNAQLVAVGDAKAELEEKLSDVVTQIWHYGNSAPSDTKLLWIDSDSTSGGLKYYNGTSWVHVPVAWT